MKVLLSGYYGFDNTGDEAILLSLVRELRTLGHQPLVLSNDPAATTREYGVPAFARMSPPALLQALRTCDVLFSGGGGLLQDKTSARNLTYYLALIRGAALLRKRVVIFNQSIGPLSETGRGRVARALKASRARAIVRDRGSLGLLRSLGVNPALGGDPALLLSPSGGLSHDASRVIIAPRGGQRSATERLAQVAGRLVAEGRNVTALAFQPQLDDAECAEIARAVPGVQVVSTASPQLALDAIAGAGYVLGVRLHAVILAAAAGVPFAGVSYDPKVAGFCEDAGAAHVATDFDPAALAETVLSGRAPDWSAVEAMRLRARESFLEALK
ncbi:polysaccharide pyruvyl transferase CsaB [Deinobacterium chartae]|uniref:Polysaccharide pyruvyl transferase CsaB n=1 Tax=Deinobacterium chartae TaxID=521158 RepID=A0A841I4F9_9DEIO|nr:polysaccharide pyruvyl transferase CsaB [Deinobacterium chartae]